jgi:hypothetical protein
VSAGDNSRLPLFHRGWAGNILAAVDIVKDGWRSFDYSLHTAEKLAKDSLADRMVNYHSINWFVKKPADKLEE